MSGQNIACILLGGILTLQALWDLKYREILISVSIIGALGGVVGMLLTERRIVEFLLALVPAGICFVFSKLSRGAIGLGDAIVLAVIAFYYPLERILFICMLAFSIAAVIALYLLVVVRKKGDYQIPFVPFLWMGWLVDMLFL